MHGPKYEAHRTNGRPLEAMGWGSAGRLGRTQQCAICQRQKRKRETDRAMCDTPEAKTQVKDRPTNVQNARGKNASERYCTAMLNLNF